MQSLAIVDFANSESRFEVLDKRDQNRQRASQHTSTTSQEFHITSPVARFSCVALFLACSTPVPTIMLVGCTSVPQPQFAARYSGHVHGAGMELDLLRDLPDRGTSGWFVDADPSNADGRFSANRAGYPNYKIDPSFVKYSPEKPEKGWAPASFHWEGESFVVCMLYVQFTSAPNSDKLQLVSDYSRCAPMRVTAK
jgi:hypothetical protein